MNAWKHTKDKSIIYLKSILRKKREEVYVDDMLVKSIKSSNYIVDIEETFQTLRYYGMKLNLAKCAFWVSFKKFLGLWSQREA